MHRVFIDLFFLIALTCHNITGQSRFGKLLPEESFHIINSQSGILYTGIDNPFIINSLVIEGIDSLLIGTNNGIVFFDSIHYVSIPKKSGKVRLMVYRLKERDTVYIGFRNFTVNNVPEPKLMFDNIVISNNSSISKNMIMNTDSIGIFYSTDILGSEEWTYIDRFVLGYSYGGYYISHVNEGSKINLETKRIINTIGPDKQITFKIIAVSTGKVTRALPIYRLHIY
jgi:hypothetical protein